MKTALVALRAFLCALLLVPPAYAEAPAAPHADDLRSMQLEPLSTEGDAYRLVWHAWHRRPSTLTLTCDDDACHAELRYTNGYGTYTQGALAFVEQRAVPVELARSVMSAIDANNVWQLTPDLPVDGLYGRRGTPSSSDSIGICIHSPHYFIEAHAAGRSLLMYRYCQNNYNDGLSALAPMTALFDELFPEHMSQVSSFSNLEERGERLREIE